MRPIRKPRTLLLDLVVATYPTILETALVFTLVVVGVIAWMRGGLWLMLMSVLLTFLIVSVAIGGLAILARIERHLRPGPPPRVPPETQDAGHHD